jgi:uncharacterized membrane protein YccC
MTKLGGTFAGISFAIAAFGLVMNKIDDLLFAIFLLLFECFVWLMAIHRKMKGD